MRRRDSDSEIARRAEKRTKRFEQLIYCLQIFFIFFAVSLAVYLFFMQVIDVGKYRVRAKKQRVNRSFVMRGDIYDRTGLKLATDKVYSDVYAHPEIYDSSPEELAKTLAPILKIPKDVLAQKLKQPGPVITIKKDIDKNTAKEISKLHLREISMGKKNTREYPHSICKAN